MNAERKKPTKTIDCKACESPADKCAGHMQLREFAHEADSAGAAKALRATDRRIEQTRGFDLVRNGKRKN